MSHYISSLLIDPVVRQARRFSRPSLHAEPIPEDERITHYGRQAAEDGSSMVSTPSEMDLVPEDFQNVITSISGLPVILSPASEDGGLEAELQSREAGLPLTSQNSALVTASAQNEIAADVRMRTPSYVDEDISDNPLYAVPERLRSTTTSFSSSIHSLTDTTSTSYEALTRSRRNTGARGADGSYTSRMGDGSLPADDGMGTLRKQIIQIQNMEKSNQEKARLVHELMTQHSSSSQSSLHMPIHPRAQSPSSLQSQDRPLTPSSGHSTNDPMQSASPHTSLSSVVEAQSAYQLSADDLKPSYYVSPVVPNALATYNPSTCDQCSNSIEDDNDTPLGCPHYKRNVKLQCSACNRWYTCRFCHDEAEDHSLNRRETKNMLCMLCGCAQPASEECSNCGELGASYYCGVCKLWDNDAEKSIYHCSDCGICRVGSGLGKDFYHCKTCCVCMSISIRDTHRCIERSTDCDCPICGEYMFTSPQTVVFMRCGHSIHHRCYYEHMKSSYRCPICSRSIVNMEMQFRHLDRAIEGQPMPPQFRDTKAWVYCNDCCAKTSVKYHWLGLKCAVCDSYNTAQIQILSDPHSNTVIPDEVVASSSNGVASIREPGPVASEIRGRSLGSVEPQQGSEYSTSGSGSAHAQPYRIPQHRNMPSTPPPTLISDNANDSNVQDSMDTDEDNVGFWGGERHSAPSKPGFAAELIKDIESSEDDVEDDGDELMDDELEDEGDEEDHMDIFGHR